MNMPHIYRMLDHRKDGFRNRSCSRGCGVGACLGRLFKVSRSLRGQGLYVPVDDESKICKARKHRLKLRMIDQAE